MKLTVISYKVCWAQPDETHSGYVTTGGFPYQLRSIANLFDSTTAVLVQTQRPVVAGLKPLTAHNLTVKTVAEPVSKGLARKLGLLLWLPRNVATLWREVAAGDVVHVPVPGDISLIGVFVALAQRKPLFVRHCGMWGNTETAVAIIGKPHAIASNTAFGNPSLTRVGNTKRWLFCSVSSTTS